MKNHTFEKGQFVVYPAHGVGVITGIETEEISGIELRVLLISFEKDKMVVRLPLNNSISKKIRKLCSKEDMEKAIDYLRVPTKTKKMMWSRRAQEYESKINSGDLMSITQVVRDLYRSDAQPERSYSERQIFQSAINRLMKEYSVIAEIDEKQAMENLEKALQAA